MAAPNMDGWQLSQHDKRLANHSDANLCWRYRPKDFPCRPWLTIRDNRYPQDKVRDTLQPGITIGGGFAVGDGHGETKPWAWKTELVRGSTNPYTLGRGSKQMMEVL